MKLIWYGAGSVNAYLCFAVSVSENAEQHWHRLKEIEIEGESYRIV
jgi:hypothetical protein